MEKEEAMSRDVHITGGSGEAVRFSKGQGEAVRISSSGDPVYPSTSGKIVWATNPDELPSDLRAGEIGTCDEFKP